MALIRALIKRGIKNLTTVVLAGGIGSDMLIGAGCVKKVVSLSMVLQNYASRICDSGAMPVGEYMRDRFNVPYLHAPQPISIKYFREFMLRIAELVGKEQEFEEFFQREMDKYGTEIRT